MSIDRFDKVPPQSLEMEQATLGAMLLDRTAIEKAVEVIDGSDFYRPAHKVIFEAILTLIAKDEAVDLLTVGEQLKLQNRLEDIGGSPYLYQLTDALATAANAEHYAKVVREKSILRALIDASNQIQSLAHGEFDRIEDVVDQAERIVIDISSRHTAISGAEHMRDLIQVALEDLERLSETKTGIIGIPTGFSDLDFQLSGMNRGDLIILGARPSMGKTSLATQIAVNTARNTGPVAFFSMEMSNRQLIPRIISTEARVNSHRMRTGFVQDREWGQIGQSCARLAELPLYISDSSGMSSIAVKRESRKVQRESGDLALIVVDYLQLMVPSRRTESKAQELGEIAQSLKRVARDLNVPLIALAQLNREVEKRPDKRPVMSDLRDSGSLEAEADVCLLLYRAEEYFKDDPEVRGKAEVIIGKQRNGPTGTVNLTWLAQYTRFENAANQDPGDTRLPYPEDQD